MLCLCRLFLTQRLTVSATRVNAVQAFAVTFTGVTGNDGGDALLAAAFTEAEIALTFDSSNMNWACLSESHITTVPVRITNDSKHIRSHFRLYRYIHTAVCTQPLC